MYPSLSKVLVDFIDKLKSEGKLKLWYTSLKNDDSKPSFRVYLQVEDDDEEYTQSKFQSEIKAGVIMKIESALTNFGSTI